MNMFQGPFIVTEFYILQNQTGFSSYMIMQYIKYVGQSISNENSLISWTCLNINYSNFH